MSDHSEAVASIQRRNEDSGDKAKSLKESSYYQKLQEGIRQQAQNQGGIWKSGVDQKMATTYYIDAAKLSTQSDFTTVGTHAEQVKAPLSNQAILGIKIDLDEKGMSLKDLYMKAFVQSKSHNLLLAKLNGMKFAGIGFLLAMLGTSTEELQKLQKRALGQARDQNKSLQRENLYNSELLDIVSNPNDKETKAQKKVLDEILKQLMLQAKLIGLEENYNPDRMLEIRLTVLDDIRTKFKEEETHLKYQLEYVS